MFGGYEGLSTDWTSRFDTIWHVDFEYREDNNRLPVPVSMFAYEQYNGISIALRRDQLLALKRAPFGTGPRDLMIAYAANAELACFLALGWPFPCNVLDLYVETIAVINGRTDLWPNKGRPGLLAALELHGLPAMSAMTKQDMRDVIVNNTEYTHEQWADIDAYNRSDVTEGTVPLLNVMAPTIDLPRALHRGRYMAAVAREERIGLPIDGEYLEHLLDNWERPQLHYIARDDEFGLYDGKRLLTAAAIFS
jgi:DNA polymerase I